MSLSVVVRVWLRDNLDLMLANIIMSVNVGEKQNLVVMKSGLYATVPSNNCQSVRINFLFSELCNELLSPSFLFLSKV